MLSRVRERAHECHRHPSIRTLAFLNHTLFCVASRVSWTQRRVKTASHLLHFAPETISSSCDRGIEDLRDFLPAVAETSQGQDRRIPVAQHPNNNFQIQSR